LAATLTLLELPNLMVLLDRVSAAADPEATIDLATKLFRLLQNLGKPRLLEKSAQCGTPPPSCSASTGAMPSSNRSARASSNSWLRDD
jgi:hypothetical protein